jgi:hypothetical protein
MALAELLRRRRLVVAVVAGGLVGAVIGLFLPIRAADPPKSREAAWFLPNAQALKRFSDQEFRAVRGARFWGDLAMPGQRTGNQASGWSLHAIVTRPYVQAAVSANGKPAQLWVRLGGALPDGALLVAVNPDRVWFEKDGCRRVRSLYQNKNKPDSEACIGAPAGDNAQVPRSPPAPAAATPGTGKTP